MPSMHVALYDKDPTFNQKRLYDAYDRGMRGFASTTRDEEHFEAVLALALLMARDVKDERVFVIMPTTVIPWATEMTKFLLRQSFRRVRKDPAGKEMLQKMARKLFFAHSRPGECPEPGPWMMFALRDEAFLPSWAKGKLLPCPEGGS